MAALACASCSRESLPEPPAGSESAANEAPALGASPLFGQLALEGDIRFETDGLFGFLADRRGEPVFVTARANVQPTLYPIPLPDWEARVTSATARFDGPQAGVVAELTLGPPACAGLDVWASDVLMLRVVDGADAIESVSTTDRVPGPGDLLELPGLGQVTVREVYPDAFLELDAAGPIAPVPGSAVLDAAGDAVAVVSGWRDAGGQRLVDAQLLLPFLDSPARLDGERLGMVGPPMAEGSFSADGRLLVASTPPIRRVVVVDRTERRPHPPLESVDSSRLYGIGHFTADGFALAAVGDGLSGLFDIESGIPLANAAAPRGAPRHVASDRRWLAATTDQELAVFDLADFRLTARAQGSFGPVALADGRVLVGAGTTVQSLDPSGEGPPSVWAELPVEDADRPPLVTALRAIDGTVWIGTAHGLWSAPAGAGPVAPRLRLRTGYGAVNAIAKDGPLVWIGTGSLIPGEDGSQDATDCYVRVLDVEAGRERARSHHHESPVRALAREPGGWLGVAGDGTAFRWRSPGPSVSAPSGR